MMVEQHIVVQMLVSNLPVLHTYKRSAGSGGTLNILGIQACNCTTGSTCLLFAALFPNTQVHQGESSHRAQPPTLPL